MSEFFKALDEADRRRLQDAERRAEAFAAKPATPAASTLVKGGPRRKDRPPARTGRPYRAPALIVELDPGSVAAEAYRTVRTNLEFMRSDHACHNVAVTSPISGDGKSTTAANLAVAAAQSGWRVCLVDADFRRPVLHNVFGLPNVGGLSAVLQDEMAFPSVARETAIKNLSLVVSGQDGKKDAQDLFTSQRLQKALGDAGRHFDLVLYDTPPVLSVADGVTVAALCDGVILVVRSGMITPSVLQRAVRQITQVNGRVLGVLLNRVNLRSGDDDVYPYYHAYHAKRPRE